MQKFRLLRYLKPYKVNIILGPIFKLTEAVFELIVPLVMASIIDVGIKNADKAYVFKMGGVMVLLGVVGLICALTCQYMASVASQGFGTQVRNALFSHINTLSHAEIDQIGTPSLINRLTSDIDRAQHGVAMTIRMVRAPFLTVGAIIMSMTIDLKMSIIFIIAGLLIGLILYLIMSRTIPLYQVVQKKLDKTSLITRENLEGVRVIRAFSKQENEQRRFGDANEDLTKSAVWVGKISALLNPLTYSVVNLGIVAIIWFGALQVNAGQLTQGKILALANYMSQILIAMIALANFVVTLTKAIASGTRVKEILAISPSVQAPNSSQVPAPVPGAPIICFSQVDFTYHTTGENALNDINLTILPGQTIGVIGGTGSGKSTLVNLIPRFYDITHGKLQINGVDIKEYPFEALRKRIGMVPQRAVLFNGTLRENMRWANENATDEQIWQALDIAQAKEFVQKLPLGLNSHIEQGGKNLSGGQRQRLTIARALVNAPDILILDDSASALDFATDAALRKAIARQSKGMTVIMVSQRANTVRWADKIVVLDDGHIVGEGTHEELLQTCQAYREICQSQQDEGEGEK